MSLFLEMEKRDEFCHSLYSTLPDCSGIGKEFSTKAQYLPSVLTRGQTSLPQHLLCIIWYLEWTVQETE